MSTILKLFVFPISLIIICLGINTILGGHITPGGGFQGGAMIAGGLIFCIVVYGLKESPFKLSHSFLASLESAGALYNLGVDLYGIIPTAIKVAFNYPDPIGAGIIPYLNFAVGIKVLVGLSAVVIAFLESDKIIGENEQ